LQSKVKIFIDSEQLTGELKLLGLYVEELGGTHGGGIGGERDQCRFPATENGCCR